MGIKPESPPSYYTFTQLYKWWTVALVSQILFYEKMWEILFSFQLASRGSPFLEKCHQDVSIHTEKCVTKSGTKLDLRYQQLWIHFQSKWLFSCIYQCCLGHLAVNSAFNMSSVLSHNEDLTRSYTKATQRSHNVTVHINLFVHTRTICLPITNLNRLCCQNQRQWDDWKED